MYPYIWTTRSYNTAPVCQNGHHNVPTCWRSFKTFENFFACETEFRWTDTDLDGVDGCRNNRQPHRRCTGDDVNLKDSSRQNNYNYHSSS